MFIMAQRRRNRYPYTNDPGVGQNARSQDPIYLFYMAGNRY